MSPISSVAIAAAVVPGDAFVNGDAQATVNILDEELTGGEVTSTGSYAQLMIAQIRESAGIEVERTGQAIAGEQSAILIAWQDQSCLLRITEIAQAIR